MLPNITYVFQNNFYKSHYLKSIFYIFVGMKFTAEQIAGVLDGEVIGNPKAEVYKLSKIEEGSEGSITFLANPCETVFCLNNSPPNVSAIAW